MAEYDNELKFFLFPNKDATAENKKPSMTGEATVKGVKYRIAGWKATSKKGDQYLQGTLQLDDGSRGGSKKSDDDEEIPF